MGAFNFITVFHYTTPKFAVSEALQMRAAKIQSRSDLVKGGSERINPLKQADELASE